MLGRSDLKPVRSYKLTLLTPSLPSNPPVIITPPESSLKEGVYIYPYSCDSHLISMYVPHGTRRDRSISEREGQLTDSVLYDLRALPAISSLPTKQDEARLCVPANMPKTVVEEDNSALPLPSSPDVTKLLGLAAPVLVLIPAPALPVTVQRVAVGQPRVMWKIAGLSSLRRPEFNKLFLLVSDSGSEFKAELKSFNCLPRSSRISISEVNESSRYQNS